MSQRCVGASFLHSATQYERPWACAQRGPPWALSGVRNGQRHQVWPGLPGASFAQSFCVDLTSTRDSAGPAKFRDESESVVQARALSQGQSCARGHPETCLAVITGPQGWGCYGHPVGNVRCTGQTPQQRMLPMVDRAEMGELWGTHWQVGETSAGTAGSAHFRWPSSWSQRPPSTQG